MSWSYSGDPTTSPLDQVRFLIGDTDENAPLLLDAEISFAITEEATPNAAAAYCCETLARKFAKEVDKTIGPLRVSLSQKSKAYQDLAIAFRKKEATISGKPFYKNPSPAAFRRRLMDS